MGSKMHTGLQLKSLLFCQILMTLEFSG